MGNCCLGVGQSAATDNNTNKGSSTAAAAAEEEEHQRGSNVSNYDKNKIGGGQPKNKNKKANNTPAKSATKRKTNTGGNNNSIGGGGRNSTIHSVILKEHKLDVYKKYTETEVLGHGSMGHVAKVKVKDGYDGGSAYVGSTTYGKGGGNNKTARDAEKAKAAFIKGGGLLLTSSLGTTTATASGGGGGQGISSGSIDETKESIDSTTNHSIVDTNDSGTDAATDAATDGGGGGGGSSVNSSSGDVSGSKNCAIDTCYALKSIILDRVSTTFIDELKNEINILKAMDHPNIVKLHEVFSHKKQIYMILELCDGGDLYTRLPYTEKDSAYVTGKLLSAIKYMHDHGIVHRDRKY
jgi:serine/threonine protein kinase